MMEIIVGIALIVIALIIIKNSKILKTDNTARFYKKILLSSPEQEAYNRLISALPEYIILSQVSFSQMIGVEGGTNNENFGKNATAKQKVADFVVCDKTFNILVVIETDDKTHNKAKDQIRDAKLLEAGIPTIRWRSARLPSPNKMRNHVLSVLESDVEQLKIEPTINQ